MKQETFDRLNKAFEVSIKALYEISEYFQVDPEDSTLALRAKAKNALIEVKNLMLDQDQGSLS